MFELQLVIGLLIGFQFIVNFKLVNSRPLYTLHTSNVDSLQYIQPDFSMDKVFEAIYNEHGSKYTSINPEELGPFFEGDLNITDIEADVAYSSNTKTYKIKPNIWPHGVVPYEISPDFVADKKNRILTVMSEFTRLTCIRFREHTVEKDFVYFDAQKTGCNSNVGRIGGQQVVNFQIPYCLKTNGTIMHEIMHTLGFNHEQSRYDRDDYIKIVWDNVQPSEMKNFGKSKHNNIKRKESEYDYGSVMHYSQYAFGIDSSKVTLIPLRHVTTAAEAMGQRKGFSPADLDEIKAKYECSKVDAARDQDDVEAAISFQFISGNTSVNLEYEENEIDYK